MARRAAGAGKGSGKTVADAGRAKMARPRTPTKVLKALGSFKKNPKRAREREKEPEADGKLGKPPASFLIRSPEVGYQKAEKLRAVWRQIQRDAPWLDKGNRIPVESLCYATLAVRDAQKASSKNLSQALSAQARLLNDLGIPQAARSKVNKDDLNDQVAMDAASVRLNLEIDL